MSENIIKQTKDDKKFLIMAHRGFWGGNVIQNTRQAAITAKKAGADIIEVDVCRSADGVYYLFHKLVVRMLLDVDKEFEEMTSEEIDSLVLLNSNGQKSGYRVEKLEDFLDWLPINYIVNIDRTSDYWDDEALFDILIKSGKKELLFLKAPAEPKSLELLNEANVNIPFVAIAYEQADFERVKSYENIRLIGVDLRIDDLNHHSLLESNWINKLIHQDMMIIANSEHLGREYKLFDVLDDTAAILGSETYVWSIMRKYGVNVIKTDWPNFVNDYRNRIRERN